MKKMMMFILTILLIFTGCTEKQPVTVCADYVPEENIPSEITEPRMTIITLSEKYDLFLRSKKTEDSRYIVISADGAVKDFALYFIAVAEGSTEYDCEKPVLYYNDLSAEKNLIIRINKKTSQPWYGISFDDENGDTTKYAIHIRDSEVYLEKFE